MSVEVPDPVTVLRGHEKSVTTLCTYNQGSHVVSGSVDGCMKLWKIDTNREVSHVKVLII
jgi:WD40 repeat protein